MKKAIYLIIGMTIGTGLGALTARTAYPPVVPLTETSTSIIGQPIEYPDGLPKVTAAIVTMLPGDETGLHKHDAPLFAYMLSGEIEVDYGADGKRRYASGDAFIEAFKSPHNGRAIGTEQVRILAVFIGAEGVQNTVMTNE